MPHAPAPAPPPPTGAPDACKGNSLLLLLLLILLLLLGHLMLVKVNLLLPLLLPILLLLLLPGHLMLVKVRCHINSSFGRKWWSLLSTGNVQRTTMSPAPLHLLPLPPNGAPDACKGMFHSSFSGRGKKVISCMTVHSSQSPLQLDLRQQIHSMLCTVELS